MLTRIQSIIVIAVTIFLFALPAHSVTRDELIKKVIEAGKLIQSEGVEKAVKRIEDTKGPFVWNDNVNYLYLMNIKGKMLAHPFHPQLKKAEHRLKDTDANGKLITVECVKIAESKRGVGWINYMWPIPGQKKPTLKYTFIYRVPGTEVFIGSGLYVIKPGEYY